MDGDGELTFFYARIKGSNATLQRALEKVGEAIETTGRPVFVRPPLAEEIKSKRDSLPAGEGAPNDVAEEFATERRERVSDPVTQESKPKPRRTGAPKLVAIDFTSGEMPLKKYVEMKGNPSAEATRYLVITSWLKEHRSTAIVTPDHMYSSYKHLEWPSPPDISLPLRNGAKTNIGFYKKESGTGEYSLTHVGEGRVLKLGKKD